MSQRNINSFFTKSTCPKEKSIRKPHHSFASHNLSWISGTSHCNAWQKFDNRKLAASKNKQNTMINESAGSKESSQNSVFTNTHDIMDDSQNLNLLSQGNDNSCWPYNIGNSKFGLHLKSQSGASSSSNQLNFFNNSQSKKDYNLYVENVKQEQKEKYELEMLQNFLIDAKQQYEDTTDLVKELREKLDQSSSFTVSKMKECLEKAAMNLLQKITEGFSEKETILDQKLGALSPKFSERFAEIERMLDKKLDAIQSDLKSSLKYKDECCKDCTKSIENTQKIIELVKEVCDFINNSKPTLIENACQYSPQAFDKPLFCDMASQYSPYFENRKLLGNSSTRLHLNDITTSQNINQEKMSETVTKENEYNNSDHSWFWDSSFDSCKSLARQSKKSRQSKKKESFEKIVPAMQLRTRKSSEDDKTVMNISNKRKNSKIECFSDSSSSEESVYNFRMF